MRSAGKTSYRLLNEAHGGPLSIDMAFSISRALAVEIKPYRIALTQQWESIIHKMVHLMNLSLEC